MALPKIVRTFTESGMWVCPTGVTSIKVECWGGGGGGAGSDNAFSGGGGGGEYANETSVAVTPGGSYTVVVGAGGSGGTIGANGGAGGNSTFNSTTVVAHGGSGGLYSASSGSGTGGAGGTGSTNTTHHNGGAGGAGDNSGAQRDGGGGGSGGTSAAGNAGAAGVNGGAGATAVTGGGPGGDSGDDTGASGLTSGASPTSGPGGGGGGGHGGGAGADGKIVITYDDPATGAPFLKDQFGSNSKSYVEIAFGADATTDPNPWDWTDVTTQVLWDPGITINPMGAPDEFSTAPPAQCSFTLKNLTGDFTPKNGKSQYWPNIKIGTPVRVMVDLGNGPSLRFQGEVSNGFAPRWDASRKYMVSDVVAHGVKHRLAQGNTPLRSPMYRSFSNFTNAVAYYPFEDGSDSTQISSGLPDAVSVTPTGMKFASNSDLTGSAPLPTMEANGGWAIPINAGLFHGHWQVDWHMFVPAAPANDCVALQIDGSGTASVWYVFMNAVSEEFTVWAFDSQGTLVVNSAGISAHEIYGQWMHWRLSARQNGSVVNWVLSNSASLGGTTGSISGSFTGTVGGVSRVSVRPSAEIADFGYGHLVLFDDYDFLEPGLPAFGYNPEFPTDRLQRICDEEGIPVEIRGVSVLHMGPQPINTLSNIISEIEQADGGVILDGLGPGLLFITRDEIQNQAAALTISASQIQHPFLPAPGDLGHVNKFTASRKNGATVTFEDNTSPVGNGPNGIGTYDSSQTYNFFNDLPPAYRAQWEVAKGTVDEPRYPALEIELAKSTTLAQDWLDTALLSRIDVEGLAETFGFTTDELMLLLRGYNEQMNSKLWTVKMNLSPYAPWRAMELAVSATGGVTDSNEFKWILQALPSQFSVNGDVSAGATSISVKKNSGVNLWTTTAAWPTDFPLYVKIRDTKIKVTGISGTSSPQTFTVDGTTVLCDLSDGDEVTVWRPAGLGYFNP